MLEKFIDLLKLILEKYLIPTLIAAFITIISVNFCTKDFEFLKSLSKAENYIMQGSFFFLIILLFYKLVYKKIQKYKSNKQFDEWVKPFRENLINEIDTYPEQVRNIVKDLFDNQNNPITIRTDYNGLLDLQLKFRDKVLFTECEKSSNTITYLCRFTDSFYKRLCQIYKEYGFISHY